MLTAINVSGNSCGKAQTLKHHLPAMQIEAVKFQVWQVKRAASLRRALYLPVSFEEHGDE